MKKQQIVPLTVELNLQAFAEGGASGTGEGGQTGEMGTAAVSQSGEKQGAVANEQDGVAKGENSAAESSDNNSAENTQIDRNAAFEEMIKGEYKDLFDSKVQSIVKNRLRDTKDAAEKFGKLSPVLGYLSQKYGVEPGNVDALVNAIEDDDANYEKEAMATGKSVGEIKAERKSQREIDRLRGELDRMNAQKVYDGLANEAKELQKLYPTFDLDAELNNQEFASLLSVPGVTMRTAYEVLHRDEIIPAVIKSTAQAVEKRTADKIRANGMRPSENGSSAQGASSVKSDVSKLSDAEIDEYNRRIARGERISFS